MRIKTEKVSDTSSVLKLVEIKPISYFTSKYPVVVDLLDKPLDIAEIFAPASLEFQKTLIPADMRGDGVSPLPKAAEAPTTSYEFSNDKSDSEDDDET
jgi:hypothetical protein